MLSSPCWGKRSLYRSQYRYVNIFKCDLSRSIYHLETHETRKHAIVFGFPFLDYVILFNIV